MIRNWFRWRMAEKPVHITLYCQPCKERIDTSKGITKDDAESWLKLWHKYHGECKQVSQ